IHPKDSASLIGFKKLRDNNFGKTILNEKGVHASFDNFDSIVIGADKRTVEIKNYRENSNNMIFDEPRFVNSILISEDLKFGQRVKNFVVQILDENKKSYYIQGTTIGHQRILTFPRVKAAFIAIRFLDSFGNPMIDGVD